MIISSTDSNWLSQGWNTIKQSSKKIAKPLVIAAAVAIPVIVATISMTTIDESEENASSFIQVQAPLSDAVSVSQDIALMAFTTLQSMFFLGGMIGATAHVNRDSTQTAIPSCSREDLWSEYELNITDTINSCSETKLLGDQAKEASLSANRAPWNIKITPKEFLPGSGGRANFVTGKILIPCDLEEPVSIAVFELTNFIQQKHFSALVEDAKSCRLNRNTFAKTAKKIEFEGTQIHSKTMASCQKKLGWEQGVQLWKEQPWEEAWEETSEDSHTEYYRNLYEKNDNNRCYDLQVREINQKYTNLQTPMKIFFRLTNDADKASFLKFKPDLQNFFNRASQQKVPLELSAMERFINMEMAEEITSLE